MNLEIASRLVALRKENNLSQEALAEKLGISRQAVSKWERAEASPDTDNLIALAKLYHVSLDELLKIHEDENEEPHDPEQKEMLTELQTGAEFGPDTENQGEEKESGKYEQSGADVLLSVKPLKLGKYFGIILLLDANSRIFHFDIQEHPLFLSLFLQDTQRDTALARVFEAIVDQVRYDLLNLHTITIQIFRYRIVKLDQESKLHLPGLRLHHRPDLIDQLLETIVYLHIFHLARLDLGNIKDLVDQVQECARGFLDIPDISMDKCVVT